MNKKLVYIGNIISALPATLVVPLVPFIFILIDGEGRIPGMLHENMVRGLMVLYPIALLTCVICAIRFTRRGQVQLGMLVSLIPLFIFVSLFFVFYYGGVTLR